MVKIQQKLLKGLHSSLHSVSLPDAEMIRGENEFSLEELAQILVQSVKCKEPEPDKAAGAGFTGNKSLPKTITFPYSRHSSHSELCNLVKAFRPADVHPCTVDNDSWHEGKSAPFSSESCYKQISLSYLQTGTSVERLFGEFCSKSTFRHDGEMRVLHQSRYQEDEEMVDTQASQASQASQAPSEGSVQPQSSIPQNLEETKLTSLDGNSSPEARVQHHATPRRGSLLSLHTTITNSDGFSTVTPTSDTQKRRREAVDEHILATKTKRARLSDVPEDNKSDLTRSVALGLQEDGLPLAPGDDGDSLTKPISQQASLLIDITGETASQPDSVSQIST